MLKRFAMAMLVALMPVAVGAAHASPRIQHIIFQVDENNPAVMNLTMNNAANVTKYYHKKGQQVKIEIVAYGPGLHMLLANKKANPVHARASGFTMNFPNVTFNACGTTMHKMAMKNHGKLPALLKDAKVVPAGVVHIAERQQEGWVYIRP